MNTLFAIRWSLRWSWSSFRCVTITINARFFVNLIFRVMRREGRWSRVRWNCSIFCWIFLSFWSLDINHFTVTVIASDWVMTFAGIWAWVRAQGWSWYVPRLFVIHLKIIRKRHMLMICQLLKLWRIRSWWNSILWCVNILTIKENECWYADDKNYWQTEKHEVKIFLTWIVKKWNWDNKASRTDAEKLWIPISLESI